MHVVCDVADGAVNVHAKLPFESVVPPSDERDPLSHETARVAPSTGFVPFVTCTVMADVSPGLIELGFAVTSTDSDGAPGGRTVRYL